MANEPCTGNHLLSTVSNKTIITGDIGLTLNSIDDHGVDLRGPGLVDLDVGGKAGTTHTYDPSGLETTVQ
jgi:hypothetical protein